MAGRELLRLEEVSIMIGVSYMTLNRWYAWKRQNPSHELAQLLPEPIQERENGPRLWNRDDLWKLLEFKQKRPMGRSGVMGSVTHKNYK